MKAGVAKKMTVDQTVVSVDRTKYSSRMDCADKSELAVCRVYDKLNGEIET